jgi:hypothetical protein
MSTVFTLRTSGHSLRCVAIVDDVYTPNFPRGEFNDRAILVMRGLISLASAAASTRPQGARNTSSRTSHSPCHSGQ